MKIYNEEQTQELNKEELDFELGYLKAAKLFITHHEAVEAREAVYEERIEVEANGGVSVYRDLKSPAIEAKKAWDEYEDIQVYVPYTPKERAEREIGVLKAKLYETDYQAIKFAEGEMGLEEYAETKAKRAAWRKRINELEEEIQ
ncbi:MAG: hypothetical protein OSJ39_00540 [Clostridia bacterium]|nr:hypothetical protein [Clostridia bacterium]